MCVRERERGREREADRRTDSQHKYFFIPRMGVLVYVCIGQCVYVCVCVCVCMRAFVRVCVCVCERERERVTNLPHPSPKEERLWFLEQVRMEENTHSL